MGTSEIVPAFLSFLAIRRPIRIMWKIKMIIATSLQPMLSQSSF